MQAEQKITVLKSAKCDNVTPDDRSFLIDMRRALLQQLSVIEKKLGITRKCRKCGQPAD